MMTFKDVFRKAGSISNVRIKYDRAGRSLGEATVFFKRRADALNAIEMFDNVELDGTRFTYKGMKMSISLKRAQH